MLSQQKIAKHYAVLKSDVIQTIHQNLQTFDIITL